MSLTFGTVAHAALCGLQVVDHEVTAVAYGYRDAKEAAVFGAAMVELPSGTGRELL